MAHFGNNTFFATDVGLLMSKKIAIETTLILVYECAKNKSDCLSSAIMRLSN